jgi:hypothetical protein
MRQNIAAYEQYAKPWAHQADSELIEMGFEAN